MSNRTGKPGSNTILRDDVYFHTNNNTGIVERPKDQCIEFYTTGITFKKPNEKFSRQYYIRQVYHHAESLHPDVEISEVQFPINIDDHRVMLIPEHNNPHDATASNVVLVIKDKKYDIGYVPKKISNTVAKALVKGRLTEGKILRVSHHKNKKYYVIKVVFGYDGRRFLTSRTLSYERLQGVVDEL